MKLSPKPTPPTHSVLVKQIEQDLKENGVPRLLWLREAAEAVDLHYMTLYDAVKTGKLTAFRAPGYMARWRVRRIDLAHYIASQTN